MALPDHGAGGTLGVDGEPADLPRSEVDGELEDLPAARGRDQIVLEGDTSTWTQRLRN